MKKIVAKLEKNIKYENFFEDTFKKRCLLFDYLVKGVISYDVGRNGGVWRQFTKSSYA